jgi:hypothetical protein
MDSGIGDTSTLAPTDSVSNTGNSRPKGAPRSDAGNGRRPPTNAPDKNAPPGAVPVPKGGQNRTGKKSEVVSATIPISGWGEIDLSSHRKDIQPTFTVDAQPYEDLVDAVYLSMQSRYSTGGKHVPYAMFKYYCYLLWWYRVLWLHKANGNVLGTEEKNFLNVMSAGEEMNVPNHVAQYLANLGNFVQGGETFYFRKLSGTFGATDGAVPVRSGWLDTQAGIRANDSASFWKYSQLPVPGVYTTMVCNEADSTLAQPIGRSTLDHIAPEVAGQLVYPTRNISGWRNEDWPAHHSSWRSTYSSLGWTQNSLPADDQTVYHISTSTMKWMSERLATIKDFKVHSSKQLALSVNGNPIQAYFLGTEIVQGQIDRTTPQADADVNRLNGTFDSDLALLSRYGMDPKMLAPSFSFGYRLERQRTFRRHNRGVPEFYDRSNYQPWIFYVEGGAAAVNPPAGYLANMNESFSFGSGAFINVRRFATHELKRSVGLDAALVLSDTR